MLGFPIYFIKYNERCAMKEWEQELYLAVEAIKSRLEILRDGGIHYIVKNNAHHNNTVHVIPEREERLNKLRQEKIGECQRCSLCSQRTNLVFGAGSSSASILFVGEAPGSEEDLQGQPFVGKSGKLLTKMIEAMGFKRESVYICNVVKCRPPKNRDPLPEEIAACEPFLKEQISIIQPKIIVGLGRYACQTLLRSEVSIAKLRGIWHEYNGIRFMPTFHPAYLLRNPNAKKEVWDDLKAVMLEIEAKQS